MKNLKKVVLVLSTVTLSMGFAKSLAPANSMKLPEDSESIVQVYNAQVVSVEDGCPKNAKCVAASTIVTLGINLNCTESLTPVTYSTTDLMSVDSSALNKLQISYTAYRIINKFAAQVKCM